MSVQIITKTTPYAAAAASVLFALIQWPLIQIYSKVHWGALFNSREKMPETLSRPLFDVLSMLDIYRVLAGVVAVAFALWAVSCRPRWVGTLCLVLATASLLFGFGVRM